MNNTFGNYIAEQIDLNINFSDYIIEVSDSVNWEQRQLIDSSDSISIDWNQRTISIDLPNSTYELYNGVILSNDPYDNYLIDKYIVWEEDFLTKRKRRIENLYK